MQNKRFILNANNFWTNFQISNGNIDHLETRRNVNKDGKLKVEGDEVKSEKYFDLFLNIDISKNSLLHLIRSFRHGNLADVTILKEQLISIKGAYSLL